MHDLDPHCMHSLEEEKKKTGQHIVQLFGTESGVRHVVLGMCGEPYVKIAPSMHVQYVH